MRRSVTTLTLVAAAALPLLSCATGVPPAVRVAAPLGQAGGEFRVLLPPPNAGAGPFPVIYFLHDLWGSDAVLWKHGIAPRLAVRLRKANEPT